MYVFFLGIRLRNFYFFSVTNPAIEFGGIAGERKQRLQDKIPKEFRPNSALISREMDTEPLLATMYSEFDFPVVVKPNQGEQGKAVKIIKNQFELETYHKTVSFDYLLQEYMAYSKEYSIMVYTNPTTKEIEIGGITIKEYPSVTGNGKLSLRELIYKNDRTYLQLEQLKKKWGKQWNNIIPNNERFVLNKIGNHNLGTKFLCANHLIDRDLCTKI